ncbi:MAG: hypothetical protein CMJ75_11710 [Planctomycetaceae bacterium]|nr:hypothetical protein [Planctomycetaceae bacterium]
MLAELVACATMFLAAIAEVLHSYRCRRLAPLAFGPRLRPASWVYAVPLLRVLAVGSLVWGLVTLLQLPPRVHQLLERMPEADVKHLVLVLDVSPSMRLQDAGPDKQKSRRQRARDLMDSLFDRVALPEYKVSVIAVYNGAKPVVEDTRDIEVIRNILDDLPLEYAFPSGKTNLFSGLEQAARLARPWRPRSTTVLVISDGDTVPATGMPQMPAAVKDVLVVGVGDPISGKFIDGRQSRQDASTLRQLAQRLSGHYHNGNAKQIGTSLLERFADGGGGERGNQLTRREYAIAAIIAGGSVYALLPLLLQLLGSGWRPGVRHGREASRVWQ